MINIANIFATFSSHRVAFITNQKNLSRSITRKATGIYQFITIKEKFVQPFKKLKISRK